MVVPVDPALGHRMDPRQKRCLDCGAAKWDIINGQLPCPNSSPQEETPCASSPDGSHCECWYDSSDPCCYCGEK